MKNKLTSIVFVILIILLISSNSASASSKGIKGYTINENNFHKDNFYVVESETSNAEDASDGIYSTDSSGFYNGRIDPKNEDNNFTVVYQLDFDTNDKKSIQNGHTKVDAIIHLQDACDWFNDYAIFKMIAIKSDGTSQELYYRKHDPGDEDWNIGVHNLPTNSVSLKLYFSSDNSGANNVQFDNIRIYFYDEVAPEITEISATNNYGRLGINESTDIYVKFNEAVYVTGTPQIKLNSGTNVYATYVGGSGTDTLKFKYIVKNGEKTDRLNIDSTIGTIEGGTIKDQAGNEAVKNLIGVTNNLYNEAIVVDGVCPTVKNIKFYQSNKSTELGNSVWLSKAKSDVIYIKLFFDEPVLKNSDSQLILNNGGVAYYNSYESYDCDNDGQNEDYSILTYRYEVNSTDNTLQPLNINYSIGGTGYFIGNITDRSGTVNYLNKDLSSFSTTLSSKNIGVDNTLPVLEFVDYDNGGWDTSHFLAVKVIDNQSGIKGSQFKYHWSESQNEPNWDTIGTIKSSGESVSIDLNGITGEYYLHIYGEDNKGNTSYIKTSVPRQFDNTPPVVTFTTIGEDIVGGTNPSNPASSHNASLQISDEGRCGVNIGSVKYQWVKEGNSVVDEVSVWQSEYIPQSYSEGNNINISSTPLAENSNGYPDSHGNWRLAVKVSDVLGNTKIYESKYFLIDKVAPSSISITPSLENTDNEYLSSYDVTISAEDNNVLGKDYADGTVEIRYLWSNSLNEPSEVFTSWDLYTGTFTFGNDPSLDGTQILHVKARDNSGNISYVKQLFTFDTIGPNISFSKDGDELIKQNNYTSLQLSDLRSEVDFSSINYQWCKAIDNPPVNPEDERYIVTPNGATIFVDSSNYINEDNKLLHSKYTSQENNDLNGDWYLVIKVSDINGNESTKVSKRFRMNNRPLTGNIDIIQDMTNTGNIEISLTTNNMNEGVTTQCRRVSSFGLPIGDGSWKDFETFISENNTVSYVGEYSIYVEFQDSLGNISSIYSDSVIHDVNYPTADVVYSETNWTNKDVVVSLTNLSDDYTNSEDIKVINNDGNKQYTFTQNGSSSFIIEDLAGNRKTIPIAVDYIDKEVPSITLSSNESLTPSKSVSTSIQTCTDNRTPDGEILMYYQWSTISDSEQLNEGNWVSTTTGTALSLDTVTGDYYLHVKAVDGLGNVGIYTSNKFVVDNTPPVATVTYSETNRTANPVRATVTFDEITTITIPSNGNNYYIFSENGEYSFDYVDVAGNTGSITAVVDWIDKNIPSATVAYSTLDLTKENVTVTIDALGEPCRELINFDIAQDFDIQLINSQNTDDGRLVQAVYEVRENGSFTFYVKDADTGLMSKVTVNVNNIDKELPTAEVNYSTTEKTQENITVSLTASDNTNQAVQITPPLEAVVKDVNGSTVYEFSANGDYTFTLEDVVGNINPLVVSITNIDREAPTGTIEYTPAQWTNGTVIAVLQPDEEVTVLNNNGQFSYEFIENGTFTFQVKDLAGNEDAITAEVSWIETEAPTYEVIYSTLEMTNQDVEVIINAVDNSNDEVIIIPPEGVLVKEIDGVISYVFTQNGQYQFQIEDLAGNTVPFTIDINNIDKEKPDAEVVYSETGSTNKDIVVNFNLTEEGIVTPPLGVIVDKKIGSTNYIFSENGIYEFTLQDMVGNTNTKTITISNIDRTAPEGRIVYSNENPTKDTVIATLKANEDFVVANNFNLVQREFKENGSYTFIIQDLAGNRSEVTAQVTNIDKTPPIITVNYSEVAYTNQNVTATMSSNEQFVVLNNNGSETFEFQENGTFRFRVADILGNETTVNANVENIDKDMPYIIFDLKRTPVFLENQEYNLNDFVAYDEIDGNITNKVSIDYNGFDIASAGEYYVKYSVTDSAGNTRQVTRKVIVISKNSFRVFVNGVDPNFEGSDFDTNTIYLDIMNSEGDVTTKWKYGKMTKGEIKYRANILDSNQLQNLDAGWYTIYVQDQERNSQLINVFITSTNE